MIFQIYLAKIRDTIAFIVYVQYDGEIALILIFNSIHVEFIKQVVVNV